MIRLLTSNGRLLALTIAILIVAGLSSLLTLPRSEDPRITNRMASVITPYPGASAERVEALVSEKIENKLRKLSQIKLMRSSSRPGISVIQIELKDAIVDPAPVWSRVRDLLNDITPMLPQGVQTPSLDDDHGYAFTLLIALKWAGPGEVNPTILARYAEALQNRLRIVSGTDFVELFGEPDEEILVALDPDQAGHLQLSPAQVAASIAGADAKVSAGELINARNQLQVELRGALDSEERIRSIPLLSHSDGSLLRLGDIAQVTRQVKWPAEELALVDQSDAVVVAVRMLPEVRIGDWTAWIKQKTASFERTLPANIELEYLFDQSEYTEHRLGDLMDNVMLGFMLIITVLLITLGWRAALIVSLALPLTVLFTLTCMNYYGLPIHQMSVTGLVVALGIMVDNAIVMTDSIQQRKQQGESTYAAVSHSVRHLWLPLLGSTITTILAFMPIVLMPGPAGEFVGGIALSVIFSLIGSYLISHTLIAGLAGRFIKPQSDQQHWYKQGINIPLLNRIFNKSLDLTLRYPLLTVMLVVTVPLSGFIAAGKLTEQFFPPSDRDMFHIELYLPAQASISETRRVSLELGKVLQQHQEIEQVRWFVGNNAPAFYYNMLPRQRGAQNYAQAMVTVSDFSAANRLIPQLQQQLDQQFPAQQIIVRKLEQGPPFNAPVELRVFGSNLDQLKQSGQELRRILSEIDDVVHTRATLQPGTPKVWLDIHEEMSRISGFNLTDVAGQLQGTLQGVVKGSVLESTELIPVRVRVGDERREDLADLASLSLSTARAEQNFPLSALAELQLEPSKGAIPRRNGERVNVVEAYIRAGVLPATVLTRLQDQLQQQGFELPSGYRLEVGGESAERDNAVGNLLASVGIILTLLIAVVVLSFNSFRISGLIFITAFFSAGLGLLCVYLFNYPFGFTVIIGLLGLMGLAINAAIVILAELKADAAAINGDVTAIKQSVLSCTRHITSTTITTVGGFLPLILAEGGFWPPFAIAIAGGTVLATLLSFYFVPAMFLLLSRRRPFELMKVIKVGNEKVILD